jgi:uncharacterized protein YndB with AHSA1/START domain
MKPITVTTVIDRPIEAVFDHLDDLDNHEAFTNHFMTDWTPASDKRTGVGAKVRFKVKAGGRHPWSEIEVLEAERPHRSMEEGRGGPDGRRHTRGTYELSRRPDGGTDVTFTLELLDPVTTGEKLQMALGGRAYLKRLNAKAMARLKAIMEAQPQESASSEADGGPAPAATARAS